MPMSKRQKLGQRCVYLRGFYMADRGVVVLPGSIHKVLFPDDATVLDFIAYVNTRRAVSSNDVLGEEYWRDRHARFWTGTLNLEKIKDYNRSLWSCFEKGTRTVWLLDGEQGSRIT
jgi:hypothetical protein